MTFKLVLTSTLVQLLAFMPPHTNGLLPLSFGLFHQSETVRELTIDIFNELRSHPVSLLPSFLHSSANQLYACSHPANRSGCNSYRHSTRSSVTPTCVRHMRVRRAPLETRTR